ncbi:MAG: HlyD family efflux transporter periplasmic adaptor subunit, partial [Desulfovibrio sp.]|nr:HlyD family efflux transporter periplasmic adaptor subunit [Desulfovibrio sp.]
MTGIDSFFYQNGRGAGFLAMALLAALLLCFPALPAFSAESSAKAKTAKPGPLPVPPAEGASPPEFSEPLTPDVRDPVPRGVPNHASPPPAGKKPGLGALFGSTAGGGKAEDGGADEKAAPETGGGAPAASRASSSSSVPAAPPLSEEAYRELERRGIVRVEIRPARPWVLAAPFSAQLAEIAVHDGEAVEEGRLLTVFDAAFLERDLEEARQAMAKAIERVQNVREEGERVRNEAVTRLARAADMLRDAEERLAGSRQRAPFKGRVTAVQAKAGQHLKRGESILELAEDGDMEVVCSVPSAWVSRLESGRLIWIYVEELGRSYEGEFVRFGGRVDSSRR